ncbi:MAG: DNA-3-methyladenine glycosylase [Bacteroidales bacterium]|nr:DNA-3-methyladenine glycosylase [Bacteroidales bacterium]MBN2698683.1 DNA-3-methyladenine glycosylase [Bacteroidales bacterium]
MDDRLDSEFYSRDVLYVAPALLGMKLIRCYPAGEKEIFIISETEAYKGTEDLACHASKGLTARNRIMFERGGHLYLYLIYGMYWMMNVVTGGRDVPQAVLIRGLKEIYGPGRVTRRLQIDGSFNGEDLLTSRKIWIEKGIKKTQITAGPRIGIDYAGEFWKNVPWRFYLK